jgi:hypothetical protein
MPYGFDQPSCDIARAFFKVLYRTPPISSASHESGTYRRNANLDKFDATSVAIVCSERDMHEAARIYRSHRQHHRVPLVAHAQTATVRRIFDHAVS